MKLSSSRFDMETARLERPTLKNYAETLVGGSTGTAVTTEHPSPFRKSVPIKARNS
jgi:hypothetical protein